MKRYPVCAVAWAVALVTVMPLWASSPQPRQGLFGGSETFSPDNSNFYKWNGMLRRFKAERRAAKGVCPGRAVEGCEPKEWQTLVDSVAGLDVRAKIARVNTIINSHLYVASIRNWGDSNHWETPFEFFRKGGQCEDYAIAKYMVLRESGMPARALRLVVVRDMHLNLVHAVLVAYVEGEPLLLDNQKSAIVPTSTISYYWPYYAINEQGWWLYHRPSRRIAGLAVANAEFQAIGVCASRG